MRTLSQQEEQECGESEFLTGLPRSLEARFLKVAVHALTEDDLNLIIATAISTRQKWLVANHNLHSLYLWHAEPRGSSQSLLHRYFRRAEWTHIDGMAMVLLARLYGFPVGRHHRVPYNRWIWRILQDASRHGWRVFYLGSSPQVAEIGASVLRRQFPGLLLKTRNGFFETDASGAENQRVVAEIAAFRPNILFVGMGMPRQERWIEENFDRLETNVIFASGACLDYIAGALPMPPTWIGQMGLEWAYRFVHEPRRLGFRYVVEPWLILLEILKSSMRRPRSDRQGPLEDNAS